MMRQLIHKIILTSGAKIYSVLLGIIALSITARWLGPEGRGIIATVITWVEIAIEVTALSLGQILIFKASRERQDNWLGSMLGILLRHTVIVSLFSWAVVALLYFGGTYWGWPRVFGELPGIALLIGFIVLPFGLWDIYSKSLLNIEDKLSVYNRYQVIGSSVNTLAIILFIVVAGFGVLGVLVSKVLWSAIIAYGGVRNLLGRVTGPVRFQMAGYVDLLKNGAKFHLGTIGAIMTLSIDIVMVNAYLGNESTGIYQLAVQMSQLMLIVSYAATTVLEGELTRKGVQGIWPYQKKILALTVAFIIVASLFMGATAKWWIIWLAGDEFSEAILVFQLLLVTIVVNTITAIMNVQWIGRGWFVQHSLITLFKGVMNIALNALLIPHYGILGAVYATIAVVSFSLFINIGLFIYCERDNRQYRNRVTTIT